MTVLHIGTYKTGSTALQLWLRDHPDLLAAHGYRFPHGWLRRDNHLELALGLMDPERLSPARMRGDEWRDAAWCTTMLDQVTTDIAVHGHVMTILSAEDTMLLRTDRELAALRETVGDAHVVMYLREPGTFLAAWSDTLTGKLDLPLSDQPADFNCVNSRSQLVDYPTMLGRWASHFTQVTILNYERATIHDGTVIPTFTRLLGIPDTTLGDLAPYWLNGRGGTYDHREPGVRWTTGAPFGVT